MLKTWEATPYLTLHQTLYSTFSVKAAQEISGQQETMFGLYILHLTPDQVASCIPVLVPIPLSTLSK